jgi:zinc transport system substrate-binding protein
MKIRNVLMFVILSLTITTSLVQSNIDQTIINDTLQQTTVKAAVSIVPQVEWLEEIGGEHVDVLSLIPEGQSPHTYEPTTTELIFMDDADFWFSIGLLDFDKANKAAILEAAQNPSFEFVNLSIGLDLLEIEAHEHEGMTLADEDENVDPHTWLSPSRTIKMIEKIRDKLQELDPTHATEYDANAASYISQLTSLNATIANRIDTIQNKHMLVFHPSWGYYAHDFGLELISLEEEGKEPSSSHFAEIVEEARLHNVGVIFIQEEFSTEIAQAFADEACVEIVRLYPMSANYFNNLNWTTDILVEKLDQAPDCQGVNGFTIGLVLAATIVMTIPILIRRKKK